MTKTTLKQAPKVQRLAVAKDPEAGSRVDRTGGRYSAGIIRRVSLCSRGEALGHYMWIDDVMLQQIVDGAPTGPKFLKSRFTHPDLCSDGMGKALGTIDNVTLEGDQVYGDLHFYKNAHDTPDGDLADYVMGFAEEDPANFGLSIVFSHDYEAEDEFEDEHTKVIELKDEDGNVVTTRRKFQSPDPNNVQNLPHCRLAELRACDVVDEPAANPNGLFHRENELLNDGTALIDFIVGRSNKTPKLSSAFGAEIAPERLRSFFSKYLAKAGLTVSDAHPTEEDAMASTKTSKKAKLAEGEDPKENKDQPEGQKPADSKEPAPTGENTDGDPCEDPPMQDEDEAEENSKDGKSACSDPVKADLAKFCSAFGHERGSKYYLDGVSFEAAQSKELAALRSDLAEKQKTIEAFAKSGIDPVAFSAAKDKGRDENNKSALGATNEPQDNRSLFASLNTAVATTH